MNIRRQTTKRLLACMALTTPTLLCGSLSAGSPPRIEVLPVSNAAEQPGAAPASGRVRGSPAMRFESLLRDLGDPQLSTREDADKQILGDPGIGLGMIEDALSDQRLSPEQRARLEKIGTERFALTPRAALGVTFDSGMQRYSDGVAIMGTSEGFDAQRVLNAGDVIHSMSGVRVRSFEDARRIISSHDPGERMTLQIFRNSEPLLVRVALGSYDELVRRDGMRGNSGRTRAVLEDAWKLRMERRGIATRKPHVVDGGLTFRDLLILEAEMESAVSARRAAALVSQPADRNGQEVAEEPPIAIAPAGGDGKIDVTSTIDYGGLMRQDPGGNMDLVQLRNEQKSLMLQLQNLEPRLRTAPQHERELIMAHMIQLRGRMSEIAVKIKALEAARPRKTGNGAILNP